MRLLTSVLPALVLLAGFAKTATRPSDETAIRQVIQRYVAARNQLDVAALKELFTPDADQLISTGQWRHGLNDLLAGAEATSKHENGNSSVAVESVRLIGHDVAIADGRYETSPLGASTPRKMWSTFVLTRTNAGWRIAAIRNMLPAAASN
jgi:uncharacterized protein (TIGR02246 family)